jgi:dethiobiotin synthetase
MHRALIVVTGTGTNVGKTHVSAAMLLIARKRFTVASFKPLESGIVIGQPSDSEILAGASMLHVKPLHAFSRPISPHLAARQEGITIRLDAIARPVDELKTRAEVIVVELAGGLFSPVSETLTNADVVRRLAPTHLVVVAPDRLGVLHDVGAIVRAASTESLTIAAIVLNAPQITDASTGTNLDELQQLTKIPVFGAPFGSIEAISINRNMLQLLRFLMP